jgi:quercetin dioxygenase-like cupin family protein
MMHLTNLPFEMFDWATTPPVTTQGETGEMTAKGFQAGDFRIRQVTYHQGYLADHWCAKGHLLFVLEGELVLEFSDGKAVTLKENQGFTVDDLGTPHRVLTPTQAAQVLIID